MPQSHLTSFPDHVKKIITSPSSDIVRAVHMSGSVFNVILLRMMEESGMNSKSINPYAAGGWFGQYKIMQNIWKMTETLANGYSYESAQRELSNEYQHDRVQMVIKNLCVIVLGMKVATA